MDRFAARARFVSSPNRLTEALARTQPPVLDLTESNPTRVGLSPSYEQLAPLLVPSQLAAYAPEPLGLLAAREVIARELRVPASQILLTASTSEAYGMLFKLLCDPGDGVLVPTPSYPLFDVLAQLEQVRLIPYQLGYDGSWHIEDLRARAARAIVLVHPNNPTGSFIKRDELTKIAALGLPIISDEVFADYALTEDRERAESALEATDALVFRMSGLSKACALPQLKLAWTTVTGPRAEEAMQRLEHIADAYLSPGAAVQHALPQLLALAPAIQARIRERVRTNLASLKTALHDSPADVLRVEGGWYAVVRLPNILDDEHWALTLLERDAVLVQPGYYYELRGTHVVLSLIAQADVFADGASRLRGRIFETCSR